MAEITRKVEIAFENTVSSYSKRECPSVLYRVVFEATTDHMKKTLVVRYYDDEALMRRAIENTSLERVVSAAVLVLESELNV